MQRRVGLAIVRKTADDIIAADACNRFINRELSWLAFNERVMEEADNQKHPILERLRFLSISANNLDEFYMVRVAGLKGQVNAAVNTPSQDGMTPSQQLAAIAHAAGALMAEQQRCWTSLRAELEQAGLSVVEPEQLTDEDRHWLSGWFGDHILPALTPMAIDPAQPFPFFPQFRSGDGASDGATLGRHADKYPRAPAAAAWPLCSPSR